MYVGLEENISRYIDLTSEDFQEIKSYFTPKKLRRKQLLLEQGDVGNRMAFIQKGALYSYSTDDKGAIHVVQFAFEGWWMADLFSFFTGEPSKLSIEALEDSELLLINTEKHDYLLSTLPCYESYIRHLYQNAYIAMQRRIEETNGLTAEDKFSRFKEHYAHLLLRVPQHLIASYLGVTPETLSRIRKSATQ